MGYHPKLDSDIWPGIWNPDWDKRFEDLYGYDPGKARKLLEEAGYKDGFEFTVYLYTLPGLPEIIDIGQALALDWEAVGSNRNSSRLTFPGAGAYRTKTIHGSVLAFKRHALRALDTMRLFHKNKDSVVYS